jgi:hypothetical protein
MATATPTPAAQAATATKPVAEKKEPKEPKAKKEATGIARPRLPRPPDDHIITVLKPNAKTGATGERFKQARTGMTVKQWVDLMTAPPWNRTPGEVYRDLRWNTDPHRQLMHIGPTVVPVPEPAPAPAAQAKPAA